MTPAKPPQMIANMTTRQKATAAIFAVIVLVILWQVWGMIGGGGGGAPAPTPQPARPQAMSAQAPGAAISPQQITPQPAELPKPQAVVSQRESDLMKLQRETESKYIAAINELQMLRIERDIAETNKAIMAAKLDTITAEKNIVDLLKPPPPITTGNYAQSLVAPVQSGAAVTGGAPPTTQPQAAGQPTPPAPIVPSTPEVTYTVISVSQLQNRWNAVMGFQGNLYNVYIGDILPPDQSKVISIDKSGVMLERNGMRKKISMVPII